jgi:diguanylate cyclase (GGDEF)-like protein
MLIVDLRTLLIALTINLVTIAVVLPAVMGRVDGAARRAQGSAALQALGWVAIIASGFAPRGGWLDGLLSTVSMAGMAASLALLGAAFDRWCGRPTHPRLLVMLAVLIPLGYGIGFAHYAFRVGWANTLLALQMVLVALALGRRAALPIGRWRWLVGGVLVLQAGVTLSRGVLGAFFTDAYPRFLTPHPVNYASAFTALATSLLTLVGILLAHRDEAARELRRLAAVDGLTGVLNRRAWLDLARARLRTAQERGEPAAVLMIDVDRFKQINDHPGHETGDRALALVARELRAAAGDAEVVGRYGGEEFCVLMAPTEAQAAQRFDERLRAGLTAASRAEFGFPIRYSAGFSRCRGAGDSLEAMLARADAALYRAKDGGRARTLDTAFGELLAA